MKLTKRNDKFVQGIYQPKHSEKYRGHDLPRYMSSWELKLFRWCDCNPNVLEWGSETVVINYTSPLDNRNHRYIVDAYLKLKTSTGIKKFLVEVKPSKQTIKPQQDINTKKQKKNILYEQLLFIQNTAKWEAAKKWCKDRGYEFTILTEKELNK
jgi:hypothetical protein